MLVAVGGTMKERAHGGTMGSPVPDGDRVLIGETELTFRRELP